MFVGQRRRRSELISYARGMHDLRGPRSMVAVQSLSRFYLGKV